mmetsp:Transcript_254/g.839  ORF Transcript_254/g.839 Transcript_254/m.839 type:complete len:222 (+) Transcript_254:1193-1858(+)
MRGRLPRGSSECDSVHLHGRYTAQIFVEEHHVNIEREVLDINLRDQPLVCRGPRVRDRVRAARQRYTLPGSKSRLGQGQGCYRQDARVRARALRLRRLHRYGRFLSKLRALGRGDPLLRPGRRQVDLVLSGVPHRGETEKYLRQRRLLHRAEHGGRGGIAGGMVQCAGGLPRNGALKEAKPAGSEPVLGPEDAAKAQRLCRVGAAAALYGSFRLVGEAQLV